MSSHLGMLKETVHMHYYINVIKCLYMCYEILVKLLFFTMYDHFKIKWYVPCLMSVHDILLVPSATKREHTKNASLLTPEHFFELCLFQT